ncbi:transcription factor with AP2 domain(s), putative [Plasmodium relictum]|uniref:Transcription factor with AP2 domain(S), putative n=1 Tax=Plasmodium relictum TaxID=85471 RepID=A0A1J1HC54_PLARL|nr:transcription factor with AP2 domain(s), putative [Plasmodium relictum]CRH00996.1 transcription factor with AP2 domain(s), putative [Plasmodium relictum]
MDKFMKLEKFKLNNKVENYKNYIDELKKVSNMFQNKNIDSFASNSTIDENKIMNANDLCNLCIDKNSEKYNKRITEKETMNSNHIKEKNFAKITKKSSVIDFLNTPIINTNDCNYINEIDKELKVKESISNEHSDFDTHIYENEFNKTNLVSTNNIGEANIIQKGDKNDCIMEKLSAHTIFYKDNNSGINCNNEKGCNSSCNYNSKSCILVKNSRVEQKGNEDKFNESQNNINNNFKLMKFYLEKILEKSLDKNIKNYCPNNKNFEFNNFCKHNSELNILNDFQINYALLQDNIKELYNKSVINVSETSKKEVSPKDSIEVKSDMNYNIIDRISKSSNINEEINDLLLTGNNIVKDSDFNYDIVFKNIASKIYNYLKSFNVKKFDEIKQSNLNNYNNSSEHCNVHNFSNDKKNIEKSNISKDLKIFVPLLLLYISNTYCANEINFIDNNTIAQKKKLKKKVINEIIFSVINSDANKYIEQLLCSVKTCFIQILDYLKDFNSEWLRQNNGEEYFYHFRKIISIDSSNIDINSVITYVKHLKKIKKKFLNGFSSCNNNLNKNIKKRDRRVFELSKNILYEENKENINIRNYESSPKSIYKENSNLNNECLNRPLKRKFSVNEERSVDNNLHKQIKIESISSEIHNNETSNIKIENKVVDDSNVNLSTNQNTILSKENVIDEEDKIYYAPSDMRTSIETINENIKLDKYEDDFKMKYYNDDDKKFFTKKMVNNEAKINNNNEDKMNNEHYEEYKKEKTEEFKEEKKEWRRENIEIEEKENQNQETKEDKVSNKHEDEKIETKEQEEIEKDIKDKEKENVYVDCINVSVSDNITNKEDDNIEVNNNEKEQENKLDENDLKKSEVKYYSNNEESNVVSNNNNSIENNSNENISTNIELSNAKDQVLNDKCNTPNDNLVSNEKKTNSLSNEKLFNHYEGNFNPIHKSSHSSNNSILNHKNDNISLMNEKKIYNNDLECIPTNTYSNSKIETKTDSIPFRNVSYLNIKQKNKKIKKMRTYYLNKIIGFLFSQNIFNYSLIFTPILKNGGNVSLVHENIINNIILKLNNLRLVEIENQKVNNLTLYKNLNIKEQEQHIKYLLHDGFESRLLEKEINKKKIGEREVFDMNIINKEKHELNEDQEKKNINMETIKNNALDKISNLNISFPDDIKEKNIFSSGKDIKVNSQKNDEINNSINTIINSLIKNNNNVNNSDNIYNVNSNLNSINHNNNNNSNSNIYDYKNNLNDYIKEMLIQYSIYNKYVNNNNINPNTSANTANNNNISLSNNENNNNSNNDDDKNNNDINNNNDDENNKNDNNNDQGNKNNNNNSNYNTTFDDNVADSNENKNTNEDHTPPNFDNDNNNNVNTSSNFNKKNDVLHNNINDNFLNKENFLKLLKCYLINKSNQSEISKSNQRAYHHLENDNYNYDNAVNTNEEDTCDKLYLNNSTLDYLLNNSKNQNCYNNCNHNKKFKYITNNYFLKNNSPDTNKVNACNFMCKNNYLLSEDNAENNMLSDKNNLYSLKTLNDLKHLYNCYSKNINMCNNKKNSFCDMNVNHITNSLSDEKKIDNIKLKNLSFNNEIKQKNCLHNDCSDNKLYSCDYNCKSNILNLVKNKNLNVYNLSYDKTFLDSNYLDDNNNNNINNSVNLNNSNYNGNISHNTNNNNNFNYNNNVNTNNCSCCKHKSLMNNKINKNFLNNFVNMKNINNNVDKINKDILENYSYESIRNNGYSDLKSSYNKVIEEDMKNYSGLPLSSPCVNLCNNNLLKLSYLYDLLEKNKNLSLNDISNDMNQYLNKYFSRYNNCLDRKKNCKNSNSDGNIKKREMNNNCKLYEQNLNFLNNGLNTKKDNINFTTNIEEESPISYEKDNNEIIYREHFKNDKNYYLYDEESQKNENNISQYNNEKKKLDEEKMRNCLSSLYNSVVYKSGFYTNDNSNNKNTKTKKSNNFCEYLSNFSYSNLNENSSENINHIDELGKFLLVRGDNNENALNIYNNNVEQLENKMFYDNKLNSSSLFSSKDLNNSIDLYNDGSSNEDLQEHFKRKREGKGDSLEKLDQEKEKLLLIEKRKGMEENKDSEGNLDIGKIDENDKELGLVSSLYGTKNKIDNKNSYLNNGNNNSSYNIMKIGKNKEMKNNEEHLNNLDTSKLGIKEDRNKNVDFFLNNFSLEYGRGRRTKVINQNYLKNYEFEANFFGKRDNKSSGNADSNNKMNGVCVISNTNNSKDKSKLNNESLSAVKENINNKGVNTRKVNTKLRNNIIDMNDNYEFKLSASELKPQRGVYFDRSQKAWIGSWYEEGKQIKKRFKIKYYGWDEARNLATKARFAFENRTKNLKNKKNNNNNNSAIVNESVNINTTDENIHNINNNNTSFCNNDNTTNIVNHNISNPNNIDNLNNCNVNHLNNTFEEDMNKKSVSKRTILKNNNENLDDSNNMNVNKKDGKKNMHNSNNNKTYEENNCKNNEIYSNKNKENKILSSEEKKNENNVYIDNVKYNNVDTPYNINNYNIHIKEESINVLNNKESFNYEQGVFDKFGYEQDCNKYDVRSNEKNDDHCKNELSHENFNFKNENKSINENSFNEWNKDHAANNLLKEDYNNNNNNNNLDPNEEIIGNKHDNCLLKNNENNTRDNNNNNDSQESQFCDQTFMKGNQNNIPYSSYYGSNLVDKNKEQVCDDKKNKKNDNFINENGRNNCKIDFNNGNDNDKINNSTREINVNYDCCNHLNNSNNNSVRKEKILDNLDNKNRNMYMKYCNSKSLENALNYAKSNSKKLSDNNILEQSVKLPQGVFYQDSKKAFCANWYSNGKQEKRYFSINKFGEERARNLAIAARKKFEHIYKKNNSNRKDLSSSIMKNSSNDNGGGDMYHLDDYNINKSNIIHNNLNIITKKVSMNNKVGSSPLPINEDLHFVGNNYINKNYMNYKDNIYNNLPLSMDDRNSSIGTVNKNSSITNISNNNDNNNIINNATNNNNSDDMMDKDIDESINNDNNNNNTENNNINKETNNNDNKASPGLLNNRSNVYINKNDISSNICENNCEVYNTSNQTGDNILYISPSEKINKEITNEETNVITPNYDQSSKDLSSPDYYNKHSQKNIFNKNVKKEIDDINMYNKIEKPSSTPAGVYMIRINGIVQAWRAEWRSPSGCKRTKNFGINTYGSSLSKKLAIEMRARMTGECLVSDDGTVFDYANKKGTNNN